MGWFDWCCCWKSETLQDDRPIIGEASPSHISSDTTAVSEDQKMGQAVSHIKNYLRSEKLVAVPGSSHEDGVSQANNISAEEPLLSQSHEALATPRSSLRRSIESTTPPDTPKLPPAKRKKSDVLYMNYPMIMEDDTIEYIKRNKLMVILKGLQGSGKSTVAKCLQDVYDNAIICSADHFFMVDGIYEFDAGKLKDAHDACQEKAREAARTNCPVIVIDNTNIRHWEYQPYLLISKKYHYVPVVIEPQTPWYLDVDKLASLNSHGVDATVIAKKLKTYQHPTPIYYGWFLNEPDSQMISKIARQWLERALLEVEDFSSDFSQFSKLESVEDMLTYFSCDNDILHVTAKFTNRGKAEGGMEYIKNSVVQSALGRYYPINVIGYVITPRTLGARIQLTEKELELWGNNDDESPPDNFLRGGGSSHKKSESRPSNGSPHPNNSEMVDNEDIEIEVEHCEARVIIPPQNLDDRRFCPTSGKGSRAHFTIGCAYGVKPVTTGFDMIDIVSCEQKLTDAPTEYSISGAVLRFYGEGRWVIYPETKAVAESLFSAFY